LFLIIFSFPLRMTFVCDCFSLRVIGGFKAQLFPGVPIYGGSHRSPALTQLVKGDDKFPIGNALNVKYGFFKHIFCSMLSYPWWGPGSTGVSQRPATPKTLSATT
jgi:hypothetical protein